MSDITNLPLAYVNVWHYKLTSSIR